MTEISLLFIGIYLVMTHLWILRAKAILKGHNDILQIHNDALEELSRGRHIPRKEETE